MEHPGIHDKDSKDTAFGVLFVCLGNICRSPTAEGIFLRQVREAGLEARFHIDSAGTGAWHTGEPADRRSQAEAARRGTHLPSRARQVRPHDFDRFDLILAMDRRNRADLLAMAGNDHHRAKIRLFREFDPEPGDGEVPDPYYGGPDGFSDVYHMCERTAAALLARLSVPSGL